MTAHEALHHHISLDSIPQLLFQHAMLVFITGFFTGAGLIIAIGAQNAFVLRVGLTRRHVLPVALFCALADALLIAAGVGGFGRLVQASPVLLAIVTWGGIAFLAWYGLSALRRALAPNVMRASTEDVASLSATLAKCAAFTFLNPHVYLDTVVLLGSLSAAYAPHTTVYGFGAATSSFVWFFSLAFGARLLAPLFEKPAAWRVLDSLIAAVMFLLAGKLLWGAL
jgi:L-lysine exporter family protein LysE/ArgO